MPTYVSGNDWANDWASYKITEKVSDRRTRIVENEIHLVRKDENRNLDYPIKKLLKSNIEIVVDNMRAKFKIAEPHRVLTDSNGFVRVSITYEAYM